MLGSFGKHSFTDLNNTTGVIHIVRDPRNVVSSIKNHFSLNNINDAKNFILAKNNWVYGKDTGVLPTFISSWKMHYLSWKGFSNNNLLIKYEDLLNNARNEIIKIAKFLSIILELNQNKFNSIIYNVNNSTHIDKFRKYEKKRTHRKNILCNFST